MTLTTTSAFDRVVDRLAQVTGHAPKRSSDRQAMARCPAHDDHNPSLSITRGEERVLLKCHSQCDVDDILARLDLTRSDLFDEPRQARTTSRAIAEYSYVDESGQLLFVVERREGKQFRQRRPDPTASTGWAWSLNGTRRVPYRLPQLRQAVEAGRPVYVVEGEKDVHSIEQAGGVATCNPGGAGKWRTEYAEHLKGADVTIVADRDEPGRAHARAVADSLRAVAASVRVVEAVTGKDATDHLAAGHALEDLAAPEDEAPVTAPSLRALTFTTLRGIADNVAAAGPPQFLFDTVWAEADYGILAAEDKAGKSWAAIDAAVSVATGTPWLGHYETFGQGDVVHFAGEGGLRKLLRRYRAVARARDLEADDLPITICDRVPRLSNTSHLEEISEQLHAREPRLVILDPLYLAAAGAQGSSLYDMGAMLFEIQHVCQQAGAALMVVTHWNKGGRGGGAQRITGVGPGAWGRVLVSGAVLYRHTEDDGATTVTIGWDFLGDEISETSLRVRRRVWAEDPHDLASPMHYTTEIVTDVDAAHDQVIGDDADGLPPAAQRVRKILDEQPPDTWLTVKDLGDRLAADGRPLKARTIQDALDKLSSIGHSDSVEIDKRGTRQWASAKLNPDLWAAS